MRDIKILSVSILLVFIFTLTFASCSDQGFMTSEDNTKLEVLKKNYKVVVLDGCEYITYDYSAGYSGYGYLAHKGNCSNPYHKDNQ